MIGSHDGVRLAVRDHGGSGRPIVLMHGAGTHLLSLETLAPHLLPYRVVAMDQRWSGQSGDSDRYLWADLAGDVATVAAELELGNPAVGGHSWGGMIALHYAAAHPEVPAVFNLDGHGSGDPSLYDGMSPAEAAEAIEQLQSVEQAGVKLEEGDAAWRSDKLAELRQMALVLRVPEDRADEFAARSLLAIGEGRWRLHPSPTMFEGLWGDQHMFDLYRTLKVPVMVLLAPRLPPAVPEDFAPLLSAYRRGLARAFAVLSAEQANIEVVTLDDAHHNSIVGRHAQATAAAVRSFLDSAGYPPT